MIDCAAFHEVLLRYRDGDVSSSRHASLGQHVAQCAACRTLLAADTALDTRLGPLGDVNAALAGTFDEAADRAASVVRTRARHVRRRRSVAVAIVVAIILAGGWRVFSPAGGSPEARDTPSVPIVEAVAPEAEPTVAALARAMLESHAKSIDGRLPLSCTSRDPETIGAALGERLFGLRVATPEPPAQWMGARACSLAAQPAAFLALDFGGSRVSVFVCESARDSASLEIESITDEANAVMLPAESAGEYTGVVVGAVGSATPAELRNLLHSLFDRDPGR